MVTALAYVLSGSELLADDLAQDAFLAAYENWDRLGLYENPGAWVRRAVANRSVSVFRRSAARTRALARLAGGGEAIVDVHLSAEAALMWRAVRSLPRRQAQVVALVYLEDLPLSDVASVLGCSIETVRTHLRRARASLAKQLSIEEGNHVS